MLRKCSMQFERIVKRNIRFPSISVKYDKFLHFLLNQSLLIYVIHLHFFVFQESSEQCDWKGHGFWSQGAPHIKNYVSTSYPVMGWRKLRKYRISPEIVTPSPPKKLENKIFLTYFREPWTTEHELKHSSFGCRKSLLSWTNRCCWIYKLLYYCFSIARLNTLSFEQYTFVFRSLIHNRCSHSLFTDQKKVFFIHLLCFSMSSNLNSNHFKEDLIYWTVLARNTEVRIIDNMLGFKNIIWKLRY